MEAYTQATPGCRAQDPCARRDVSCRATAEEWPEHEACQTSAGHDDGFVELEAPQDDEADKTNRRGGDIKDGALSEDNDRSSDGAGRGRGGRSEEHTSELQSRRDLVCRLL